MLMFIINLYKIFTHKPCQSSQPPSQFPSSNKNPKAKLSVSVTPSNQSAANGLLSRSKSPKATFTSNTNPVDKPLVKKSANPSTRYGKALTVNFLSKQPNWNSVTCRITASRKDLFFWMCLHLVELWSPWEVSQDQMYWIKASEESETLPWHTFLADFWLLLKSTTPWWIHDFCQTYLSIYKLINLQWIVNVCYI